jgi:hypothetical protein
VVAAAHRRQEHLLRDAPFGHRPVVVMWRKRIFRCVEATCLVGTFSEEHPVAGERAALTGRAITWATDVLAQDDTTVSALARCLDVGWHRCRTIRGSSSTSSAVLLSHDPRNHRERLDVLASTGGGGKSWLTTFCHARHEAPP